METISRISSMLETARELTLEVAQSASANKGFRSRSTLGNVSFSQLKKHLDSRNDREILDGMRKVISLMYSSEPCLPFFSSVVKNVASPNIEIKKLVYIYLLHHAEAEPDLALLSINAIQKSLTDQNPQVRAMALRTMSGISVPVVSQIVSLAIKRGCGDMSPHVRKAAALAIPKCYRLDPSTLPQLLEYVSTLLADNQYFVVGPAVSAFLEVCPEKIELIHKNYRSIVKKLVDMDEWSQLAALRLITIYARKCFPLKTQRVTKKGTTEFYGNDDGNEKSGQEEYGEEVRVLDPDLNLFLMAAKPLLQSRNSAVIVSVVRCFLYLGTPEHLESAVGPLVALLRSPQDIQHVALYNIVMVALDTPKPFLKYTLHFLVHLSDPPHIWRLKLEVLTILFPHCGQHLKRTILSELEHFSRGTNPDLVRESVRAIGRCAQSDSGMSNRCLQILLEQISSPDENLVSEALTVIRHLIQQDSSSHMKTVIRLAKHLDTTTSPEARASIIWLVGEFSGIDVENNIAPDVLRILAKGFADESETAKQQILLLGAKVYLHHLQCIHSESEKEKEKEKEPSTSAEGEPNPPTPPSEQDPENHPIPLLWRYILLLTRYDTSYDLRDRARLYKSLLSHPSHSTHLASLLLLAPKPIPHTPSPSESRRGLLIGSATLVVGKEEVGMGGLRGYEGLPGWVADGEEVGRRERGREVSTGKGEEGTGRTAGGELDRAVREFEGSGAGAGGKMKVGNVAGAKAGLKDKSLDDWLAEEEEEGSESEESEEEEEEGSEEEGSTEEEESEEGSEEESDEEEEESESEDEKETGKLMGKE